MLTSEGIDETERSQAFQTLLAAYWKPVYKYIRTRWKRPKEDAADLTEEFFAQTMKKGYFNDYRTAAGNFRSFFRSRVDRYVMSRQKASKPTERESQRRWPDLDFNGAEEELARESQAQAESAETQFEQEWVRCLFTLAIEELYRQFETRGTMVHFKLFQRFDLQERDAGPTVSYDDLAREFSLSPADVDQHLLYARREFRSIVIEYLRALTVTDDEFRQEAATLLGARL